MSRFYKTMGNLFGFRRSEKRATVILALILMAIIVIRLFLLTPDPENVIITALEEADSTVMYMPDTKHHTASLFPFDPNTVSRDSLLVLGLSNRQASTLINYRKTGAEFLTASDLLRVYGMDSSLVNRLTPYVIIDRRSFSEPLRITRAPLAADSAEAISLSIKPVIELNGCTATDLQRLPGIGIVLSERIIKYRDLLGGFVSIVQLREVYGIDTILISQIEEYVNVNPGSVKTISIDTCSYSDLARHPYIGREAARSIIKYRELFGPPASIKVLQEQKVIEKAMAERIAPYCTTGGKIEQKGAHY